MTEAVPIVYQYRTAKLMAKMGYVTSLDDLTDFEVRAFLLIENEFDRLKSDEMKRSSRR